MRIVLDRGVVMKPEDRRQAIMDVLMASAR
jgi:hypothetical protein